MDASPVGAVPVVVGGGVIVSVVVGVGWGAAPGWHCEYQSLSLTHVVPETAAGHRHRSALSLFDADASV